MAFHLDDDLLLLCLASLPLRSVLAARLVSRQWLASASRDAIWRALCVEHAPASALIEVGSWMRLFAKLHNSLGRSQAMPTTPPPADLSDVYLMLTLTVGHKTRDAHFDDDDEWHDDEFEYEDVPLKLRVAAARRPSRLFGGSQRELEWLLPPSCTSADTHVIRSRCFLWDATRRSTLTLTPTLTLILTSRSFLWDARHEAVNLLPGESFHSSFNPYATNFGGTVVQELPIMQEVITQRDAITFTLLT